MPNFKDYYHEEIPSAITFQEFGAINIIDGTKTIWDFRLHQEAYDMFMTGRYMRDIVAFRKLIRNVTSQPVDEQCEYYRNEVHTRDIANTFSKLAAFHVLKREGRKEMEMSFVELGSTLLGAIDAMAYIQALGSKHDLSFSALKIKDIAYYGIDISELLNETAKDVHSDYKINTYLDVSLFDKEVDVFFSKGVSILYAFFDERGFLNLINRARISAFDYTFSLGERQAENLHATGKKVVFLSLQECLKQASKGKELFFHKPTARIDREKNRLSAICYYGEKNQVEKVVAEEIRLKTNIFDMIEKSENKNIVFDNKIFPTVEKHPQDSCFVEAKEYLRENELLCI